MFPERTITMAFSHHTSFVSSTVAASDRWGFLFGLDSDVHLFRRLFKLDSRLSLFEPCSLMYLFSNGSLLHPSSLDSQCRVLLRQKEEIILVYLTRCLVYVVMQ